MKRLICVQEYKMHDRSVHIYKHWNIFFKDIFRASIEVFDQDNKKTITKEEFSKIIDEDDSNKLKRIVLIMRVLYH